MKERPDYSFPGHQVPSIPRGPRSIRKRLPRKKLVEDSRICPFELLAAVAGKLLQESESSASSNAEGKDQAGIHGDGIKFEKFEEHKAFISECHDVESCVESAFMTGSAVLGPNFKSCLGDILHRGDKSVLNHTSNTIQSVLSKDINLDLKLEICTGNSADRDLPVRMKGNSSKDENLCDGLVEDKNINKLDFVDANTHSRNDHMTNYVNSNTVISSERSVQLELPWYKDPIPSASFRKHRNHVKLGSNRDDDENYFRCNNTKTKAFSPQSWYGYRRIRRRLTSKYWKVARTLDSELSDYFEGMKPFYRGRKSLHSSDERCHRETPKRVNLCDDNFILACAHEASSESISNSPGKVVKGANNDSAAFLLRAVGPSTSLEGLQKSRDASVKLSIKSFKVPELYVEVPETATIGSLKRTVMEAVTTILGRGLDVGVVLEGKKVRDDSRTLQQAGISDDSNLETLGFTLEPSINQGAPVSPTKPSTLLSNDANPRLPSISNDPPITKMGKSVEDKLELGLPFRAQADAFLVKGVKDSKALLPISTLNMEALSVVPLNQKPKRSELSQRRTRRPFSVTEVEALVEAVETLGTGRWRDVKMRSFDNSSHRTYVDLKDKWKTLVHTASISPQQRRGEPVPQQLLDRVLCAHGYWSQHQSKQHGKHHVEALRIIGDGQVERVGA